MDLRGATTDSLITTVCNGVQLDMTGGAWFEVPTASAASIVVQSVSSYVDTVIAVFSGSCDTQQCVGASSTVSPPPGSTAGRVTFTPEPGIEYWAYVAGVSELGIIVYDRLTTGTGSVLLFSLRCFRLTAVAIATNTECVNAVDAGNFNNVDLAQGSVASLLTTNCDGVQLDGAGVGLWYKITPASGDIVTAAGYSSSDGDGFTVAVAAFEGGCDVQTCVTRLASVPQKDSEVVWVADGSEYLIFVGGDSVPSTVTLRVDSGRTRQLSLL